jgi:hypothetical protein
LRLASRLAVDPIVADLVVEVFALIDGLDETAARRRAVTGMHDAAGSLAEMTDEGARQVHTLVSRTIRLLDHSSSRSAAIAEAASSALTRRLRGSADGRVSADGATLAHARQLAGRLQEERDAALVHEVARHDFYRGDYRSARSLHEQVLDARRRILGDEHPIILATERGLAEILEELRQLDPRASD